MPSRDELLDQIAREENAGNFLRAAALAEEAGSKDDAERLRFEGLRQMIAVYRNFTGAAALMTERRIGPDKVRELLELVIKSADAQKTFAAETLQHEDLPTQVRRFASGLGIRL